MYRFWDAIIEPVLDRLVPEVIVEVGADFGFNTRNLLEYARRAGATLHVIDPLPKFDVQEWAVTYPESLVFHGVPSLEILSSIERPDVVLIDGDHNWHTVFHELKALETSNNTELSRFPLVLLHDVGWPYGQRDLYYEPDRIPGPHRHPYKKGGLRPGREELDPHGGLNSHLFNAVHTGGPRNGVLTAINDFIRESRLDMRFVQIPGINDLGILLPVDLLSRNDALSEFIDGVDSANTLHRLLTRVETLRIEAQIESLDLQRDVDRMQSQLSERDRKISELQLELQQEVEETNHDIARLEVVERELRTSLAEKTSRLSGERARTKEFQRELKASKLARAKSVRDYQRLRRRRSVRIPLALSRILRPIFRWRRRQGGSRPKPSTDNPSGTIPTPVSILTHSLIEQNLNLAPGTQLGSKPHQGEPDSITVIVPIYNAFDELRRCIDSLVRNTQHPAQLLLIDDASTDPRIADFLRDLPLLHSNIRVLRNETNLGFVRTANRGFFETQGDVVLLNSDVEVVPGWLRRLALAARSNPKAATVTPLSNNAGAFSAPKPGEKASEPPSLTKDEIGRLVAQRALRRYPETPTGSGFCMFIRRTALDECGYFDEEAFPRGYGEENDFCMRALRAGWTHIVDDATYLFHERSSSFGEEKEILAANARQTIDLRYPEYTGLVREFLASEAMTAAVDAVGSAFSEIRFGKTVRPRLLTVIHGGGGGTPATNLDLMQALSDRYEGFQLSCDTRNLILKRLANGALEEVGSWRLEDPIKPTDVSRRDYRSIVAHVLRDFDIEVVHIRHLIGHTFDLPDVARTFGIPTVLSFHDFYYVCPTVHLLDDQQRFCHGTCTAGQGACLIPTAWLNSLPHLKHAWVYEWRERVSQMFTRVDAFVTASASAREIYCSTFPEIKDRLHVIEHGRNMKQRESHVAVPSMHRPVRVLVPGNLDYHKGGDFLKAIKDHDTDGRLQLHFAGRTHDDYQDLGVHHGYYERDDWFHLVRRIRPSFVGLFSVTAETFSHTLSEAWLAGLPVIATDRGAFKDRIERDGGGWLIDPEDPKKAYHQIRRIVDDRDSFMEQVKKLPLGSLRTAEQMAADYDAVYKGVRACHEPFNEGRIDSRPIRLGLFLLGNEEARPASTYVRMLNRYMHPALDPEVVPVILSDSRYLQAPERTDIDIALVQRTAIAADRTEGFIEVLRTQGIPLLLDLDDQILDIGADHPDFNYYEPFLKAVRLLVTSAAGVTVSTHQLRQATSELNANTFLVENQLDEHLWLSPLKPESISSRSSDDSRLQILYFGSLTHGEDLKILRAAINGLENEVAVTVLGGAPEGSLGWCRQLVPDRSWNQYPDFVHWLRRHAPEFDVAAIPLVDTEFNRAKSDLKFLEATALGLPSICSRVVPYVNSVVDGKTGLLVDDDPQVWQDAFQRLRKEPALRGELAASAMEVVRGERLLRQHVAELETVLKTVLDHGQRSSTVSVGSRPPE